MHTNKISPKDALIRIANGEEPSSFIWCDAGVEYAAIQNNWNVERILRNPTGTGYYIKKPKTQTINGHTVPASNSIEEFNKGDVYYVPDLIHGQFCVPYYFNNDDMDKRIAERKMMFKERSDAVKVTKAILGINPTNNIKVKILN